MANIIIKGKTKFGKTRSEQEKNLRKEGMCALTNEQLDKCRFLEKGVRKEGLKHNFFTQVDTDRLNK